MSAANKPMQRVLRWTQRMLFACAALLLGYCTFILVNARIFQKRANATLERLVRDRAAAPVSPKEAPFVANGGLIGRIEIPRLSLSVVVVEGTDKPALRRAAGHIAGTGLPGQPGNVGIAAHRDTFFRPLRNIQRNDIITVTTLGGEYGYRVVSTKVVSPYDVAVLNPDGNEILTLVTCFPFYFVGPAPDRFIVRAERTP
jgi:sortase A